MFPSRCLSQLRRPGLQMESMYDVFSAIRDDEGDHVGTMEACLDPSVAKLSPSLERKVLTGIAAAAAAAIFLNTGTDVTVGTDLVDNVDFDALDTVANVAVDEGTTAGLVDAAIAGAAGILTQLGGENEEAGILLGETELKAFIAEVVAVLTRFL